METLNLKSLNLERFSRTPQATQIKLNQMKVNRENIMDVEFVDKTSLYLDGQLTNLQTFCMPSCA